MFTLRRELDLRRLKINESNSLRFGFDLGIWSRDDFHHMQLNHSGGSSFTFRH